MTETPESPNELTANIQISFCPNCGQPVTPGAKFCSSCGISLVASNETGALPATDESGPLPTIDPEILAGVEPGEGVLVIHRGPEQGTRFELKGDLMTVGRSPDSTIFLDDVTVSRRHAEFARDADGWRLTDVGSLNGSYVNKNRIEAHHLATGDEVQIGKYRFIFFQAPTP